MISLKVRFNPFSRKWEILESFSNQLLDVLGVFDEHKEAEQAAIICQAVIVKVLKDLKAEKERYDLGRKAA